MYSSITLKGATVAALLTTTAFGQQYPASSGASSGANSGTGDYSCPAGGVTTIAYDQAALTFASVVQKFLLNFYTANQPYEASEFQNFPNSQELGTNGQPRSQDLATNFAGLRQQAQLGLQGIQDLMDRSIDAAGGAASTDLGQCSYTYPAGLMDGSAMEFVRSAYFIEATLCGTFIGLADYVQNPQTSFLFARLAAEHGIHGSFLGSYMKDTPYSANSTMLTPAFTPEYVFQAGSGVMDVGHLGQYIGSQCGAVPAAPCGGMVEIGDITAILLGAQRGAYGSMVAVSSVPANTYGVPIYSTVTTNLGYATYTTAGELTTETVSAFGLSAISTSYASPVETVYSTSVGVVPTSSGYLTGPPPYGYPPAVSTEVVVSTSVGTVGPVAATGTGYAYPSYGGSNGSMTSPAGSNYTGPVFTANGAASLSSNVLVASAVVGFLAVAMML